MPPPKRKPTKKAKPKGLPSPCPTPFYDLRCPDADDCFIYRKEEFPASASCVRFQVLHDEEMPPQAMDYFLTVLGPIASAVHAVILAGSSLLFFADVRNHDSLARLLQVPAVKLPGTSLEFAPSHDSIERIIQVCLAELDMELGLENCPSDFSMPSTTDDEEEPQPRKIAAKTPVTRHVLPAVQPTPPVRGSKPLPQPALAAASQSTVPAPEPAAVPSTSAATLTPAAVIAEPPATSETSALAGQPVPPSTATERRRRRFRFKAVDFSALTVVVPATEPCLTLLIRPVSTTEKLRDLNSQKVAKELGALGELTCVRDIKNGGLAVDFPLSTPTAPLLALITLAGAHVTCSVPATDKTLSAVVSGIHPDISEADILADMRTSPPVKLLAVKRLAKPGQLSWSIKISVEGNQLPERALLYGRSRRVTQFTNKPLQCGTCGRFGHSAGVCRSKLRCWNCGLSHETSTCPSTATPSCPNCGGPHPADALHCPARQLEVKVCKVKVELQTTFKTARIAVQKAAKSYAAAAKSSPPAAKGPASRAPAQQNRPPPLACQPPLAGGFLPSTAHPRPPASLDQQQLISLFRGLLSILTAAVASSDLSSALSEIAALFLSHAPGADAAAFSY